MTGWWTRPQLRRDEDEGEERKVGFLDLFYDLIFVVAVAQIAHELALHPDLVHLGQFALLFAAVWWLWIGNTFYTDRFETEDVSQRVFTFLQMIPVVGMAVFAHGAFGDTALQFALSYAVGRLLIIMLWWRGGRHDAAARPVTDGYVTGFTLGLLPWIVSFAFEESLRPWLWALGLLIDWATPVLIRRRQALLPRFSHSHLIERFGLFTIIVLGETVAGTVNGLAGLHHVSALGQLAGFLAMVLAFQLWWLYFDMVPREHLKPSIWAAMGRSFLHYPLLGAIAASGAGVLSVVGHEGEVLGLEQRMLLAGSVGVALLCMIGLSRVHEYSPMFQGARFRTESSLGAGVLACAAVGWFGEGLGGVQVMVILVAITLIPIFWGAWYWAKVASDMKSSA